MSEQKNRITSLISTNHSIPKRGVEGVISLLDAGSTIPFISRYRKEATGDLDEERVGVIKSEYERLTELVARRQTILATIEEQGVLTDELRTRIENCWESTQLEDIYLPYRPKRRTRATIARELGLEPLARTLMEQSGAQPSKEAQAYLGEGVADVNAALAGASDIVAEIVSESEESRSRMRLLFQRYSTIASKVVKGKESEGAKFSDYFDSSELLSRTPSHRLMAQLRGEREGILRISALPDEKTAIATLESLFIVGRSPSRDFMEGAVLDGYKRLLRPSMEGETLATAREKADTEAIVVFATNLRQLLFSAPLGQRRVLAIDPGFRSGCKVVCLDRQGSLLQNDTIFPHPPQNRREEAMATLDLLIKSHSIEAIAIGDGTAGRETEALIRAMELPSEISIFMVSEDGASVYSASTIAREEFPDQDVTVRGAISIGRRLIDPLAELVKIDPKSIGVGQYQHDVDQTRLKSGLDSVVESCVNGVGVNLNTASYSLLSYVSGLGPSLARNIVDYRSTNGAFKARTELSKVPRLGPKAFEQSAGFLRIPSAKNPLDNSAVHPESYGVVADMAKDLGVSVAKLLDDKELQKSVDKARYISERTGLSTLRDIMEELSKPGLDPRGEAAEFSFSEQVRSLDDLHPEMVLPGIVTNVTNFGAFVDIGVKQDGLVHISQLADRYVSTPSDVVKLHQKVQVRVLEVDRVRNRISLSLRLANK